MSLKKIKILKKKPWKNKKNKKNNKLLAIIIIKNNKKKEAVKKVKVKLNLLLLQKIRPAPKKKTKKI